LGRSFGAENLSLNNPAERQVHARAAGTPLLIDRMFPILLSVSPHKQETAGRKLDPDVFQSFVLSVLQHKRPFFPETQRRNHWLRTKLTLVIRVKAHAVVVIAIKIQQNTIKRLACQIFDGFSQGGEEGCPGNGCQRYP
jgi:hypothetical protein